LEERGLVTLNLSTEDRRERIIALSEVGLKLLRSAKPLWAQAEARFEDVFGRTNALALRAMMRQITTVDFAVT
jgi:DNA-binding MarR family transcriptional regulator